MRSLPQLVATMLLAATAVRAQSPAVTRQNAPPAADLAEQVAAVLQTGGPHVVLPALTVDIWWVKTLPLKPATTEISWAAVDEGTLVGAAQVSSASLDAHRLPLNTGVYTLRYVQEPVDDGSGAAARFRPALVLSAAAGDERAALAERDDLLDAGRLATGTSQPATWLIDPPVAVSRPLTVFRNAAGLTGIVFEVPVSRDGADVGTLPFGVIMSGLIQH